MRGAATPSRKSFSQSGPPHARLTACANRLRDASDSREEAVVVPLVELCGRDDPADVACGHVGLTDGELVEIGPVAVDGAGVLADGSRGKGRISGNISHSFPR